MIKLKALTLGLSIILTSCGTITNYNSEGKINSSEIITVDNSPDEIFGIKGDEIEIRNGPGENFEKIINQKATNILNEIHYITIDHTCKVKVDETKENWSKIIVVEPDWLYESHRGWIETKYIAKSNENTTKSVELRKNNTFNNVFKVRSNLNNVGIGELRSWRNDGYSWSSSTPYYPFGSQSDENGMQNNLAYYLGSKNETFIETIKLVLNINNSSEKSEALSLFKKIAQKTFSSLKLDLPNGLLTAIKSEENFVSDNSDFKVSLTLDKSRIDSWQLIIETK